MSYRHTLNAAIESLHEIEDLLQSFPTDGRISPIDLDLSLQKIRNLYELLLMLNHPVQAAPVPPAVPEPEPVQPVVVPVTREERPEPVSSAPTRDSIPPVPPRKETEEGKILSDRFRGRTTLHETLHHTAAKEGVTLAQARPVDNLMAAIGINDRFTFIRELFANDTQFFEQTIRILNDASSFNDAYNYMIQNHDWDMDSEPVQLLLEIIRRKFITGRHE